MDLTTALASGLDPNLLAMMGQTGGDPDFTKLLMKSLNPNPAGALQSQIGSPDVNPLAALAGNAPPIQTASAAPALPGPQTLQSLGFGMAAASGKPGASALSALGEGGNQMLTMGGQMSQRAIQEAENENRSNIAEWQGKSALADKTLDAQMKEPELDLKQMDLAGNMANRQAALADTAAYRAGMLGDKATGRGIQQQRADTYDQNADTAATKVDLYGESLKDKNTRFEATQALKEKQIKERADQFALSLAQRAQLAGNTLSDRDRQGAANMYGRLAGQASMLGPLTPEMEKSIQAQVQSAFPGSPIGAPQQAPQGAPQPAAQAGPPQPTQTPQGRPQPADILKQARAAVAAGADPMAVKARLKSMGIDMDAAG